MKFMLKRSAILGTMDGANVEIYENVGKDVVIFGLDKEEVKTNFYRAGYNPRDYYNKFLKIKRSSRLYF